MKIINLKINISLSLLNMYDESEKYNQIIQLFGKVYDEFINNFKECHECNNIKGFKNKYSFLKKKRLTRRTNISTIKIPFDYFKHIITKNDNELLKSNNLTKELFDRFTISIINKIKGVFKHAQALKTGYCNRRIINGFSEENSIVICITKNTLEANEQWLNRLYNDLNERMPHIELKDKIMIISSKKNNLNGNATHCRKIMTAWGKIRQKKTFKILFMCSNKTRILDVLKLIDLSNELKEELQQNIRIFHDEAHNSKEGIPAFRNLIDNILLNKQILSYTPITASNNTISDDKKVFWNKQNLENNAYDYTNFDNKISTSPNYSSCSDSKIITFESLKLSDKWINYGITSMPDYLMRKVYPKDKNINKKKNLEFCSFMKNDKEIEAVNNGLNYLNLNELQDSKYYTKNKKNIYIISTPNRKIITAFLAEEAVKKDYKPIVLTIYGNGEEKYHLIYYLNGKKIEENEKKIYKIMGDGQFNEKILKIFKYLKNKKKINIERPFIIIGNYIPTGESLTFVHTDYGVVKGNCRLISTNAEEDYQEACRSNYVDTHFINKHGKTWKQPPKFLIGPSKYINNALNIEKENDFRVKHLEYNRDIIHDNYINNFSNYNNSKKNNIAIPIKLSIDTASDYYIAMKKIMKKNQRNSNDKRKFLNLIKNAINAHGDETTLEDKTNKFNINLFKLIGFRSYSEKCKKDNNEWKFKNYENHYNLDTSFINSNNNIHQNECEILTCIDTYIVIKNEQKYTNSKRIWWIGYKY